MGEPQTGAERRRRGGTRGGDLAGVRPSDRFLVRGRRLVSWVSRTKIFNLVPNITLGSGNGTDITQDISFPDSPSNSCPSPSVSSIRAFGVNVYRTAATLSGGPKDPLPTFFARVFGRTDQGVRATATAQIRRGMRPIACGRGPWPDKWAEHVRRQCSNGEDAAAHGDRVPNTRGIPNQFFDKWDRKDNPPVLDPSIATAGSSPTRDRAPGTNGLDGSGHRLQPVQRGWHSSATLASRSG